MSYHTEELGNVREGQPTENSLPWGEEELKGDGKYALYWPFPKAGWQQENVTDQQLGALAINRP